MTTRTLFSAQAADANSAGVQVTAHPGNVVKETVMIQGYGTWNSATVTLQVSIDGNVSSPTYVGMTTETGSVIGAFTDDFSVNIEVPTGLWFRAVLSGSGSPVPSLSVRAAGDLVAA